MVEWRHRLNGPESEQTLGMVKKREAEAWSAAVHRVAKNWI